MLKILHGKLSKLGFPWWAAVRETDFIQGDPHLYSVFFRFILCRFNIAAAGLTKKYPWFLIENSDVRLASVVLKMLREEGISGICLSVTQFQQKKFAVYKARVCLELISLLHKLEEKKTPKKNSTRYERNGVEVATLEAVMMEMIRQRVNYLNTLPRRM